MLRSISPPGLQELKLDLRWGDPRGPMGPWGDGPWILWDDFYFFIKRIRSNMIVNYDVFFLCCFRFFFSEQFHGSSIAWVSNPMGSLDMGVYIPCQLVRYMNSSSEGSLSRYILTF